LLFFFPGTIFVASSLRRFVASSLRRFVASSLRRFVASSLRRPVYWGLGPVAPALRISGKPFKTEASD